MKRTKKDLVNYLIQDLPKYTLSEVKDMTHFLLEDMVSLVQADYVVSLKNLGNFYKVHKKARPGRNPKTGEGAVISARTILVFNFRPYLTQKVEEE